MYQQFRVYGFGVLVLSTLLVGCASNKVIAPDGTEAPNFSNAIVLDVSTSKQDAFEGINTLLQLEGYSIEGSDIDTGTIETKMKKVSQPDGNLLSKVAKAFVSVGIVEFNGNTKVILKAKHLNDDKWRPTIVHPLGGGSTTIVWDELMRLGELIPGVTSWSFRKD